MDEGVDQGMVRGCSRVSKVAGRAEGTERTGPKIERVDVLPVVYSFMGVLYSSIDVKLLALILYIVGKPEKEVSATYLCWVSYAISQVYSQLPNIAKPDYISHPLHSLQSQSFRGAIFH